MTEPIAYEFEHVHIYCSNPAETERWFVDKIGAEVVGYHDWVGAPTTVLRLGGAQLLLRGAREGEGLEPPGPRCFGSDHFALRVPDLEAAAAELKRRGVRFEMEPRDFVPGMRIAFVIGPDNVRIELVELS